MADLDERLYARRTANGLWQRMQGRHAHIYAGGMVFKAVGDRKPYPEHGLTLTDWADLPPRQVRIEELITTKSHLDLHNLLSEDSTFYGDLFAHVVRWDGDLYLEDGLHRAVRAALQQRPMLHARVLDLDTTAVGSAG